ncbi:hypothetical protein BRADI_4g04890v3 [Brachypodium distachyon]|uniref:Uncharacterized protein n=2 Tax=Brachypodium distachyon TaxID=15368 RepID=A0A0Q3PBD8_BRADI|nr:hypothetical protein BRADI_4g04890v3 [Brachypodium distachyon]
METKIHRFPPGLRGLGGQYIVPMVVAIGPYHRGSPRLQEMAKVKHAAAHYFIDAASTISTYDYHKIYDEFFPVAVNARSTYTSDVVAGIEDADFVDMMFRDACFLLQYMLCMSSSLGCREYFDVNPSLRRFFFSNRACIDNDVMLLENQLPWMVLDALRKFSPVKIEDFIAEMGNKFQIRQDLKPESFVLDPEIYTPPHLLGLLRFYKLGRRKAPKPHVPDYGPENKTEAAHGLLKQISVSNAIELAEIGVRLKPSKTADFMDIGMKKGAFLENLFSGKLFLGNLFFVPLSLDSTKACWLVNMAAFEVCTVSRFKEDVQKTAVCSYIALLAMLMDRDEDVLRLRSKHLVHGNHTNKEMLDFFKSLAKHLPDNGYKFSCIMADIEVYKAYKLNRWIWIRVYKFWYKHGKTVAVVISILGAIAGILKVILSI